MSAAVGASMKVTAGRSRFRKTIRRITGQGLASTCALIFICALIFVAVAGPWLAPFDPNTQQLMERLQEPSAKHWLGTDDLGRDVFSRIMVGARVSVLAGLQAVSIAFLLGAPLGLIAGYRGGWTDRVLNLINDSFMSVPGLVLALAVVAAIGPGITKAMLAVGIVMMPRFYRLARSSTIDLTHEVFIEAAVGVGCTKRRIMFAHILPNAMPPLAVQATFVFGTAVLAEASLSYLGLGVRPPTASWGAMLSSAADRLDKPHLIWGPGIAMTLTILAVSIVADGARRRIGLEREEADD